ncbi:MAG: hypothetical protein ACRDRO_04505 [Pseudonocardiaceae bacterium]
MTRRAADLHDHLGGTTAPSLTEATTSNSASTPAPAEAPPPSKFTVLLEPEAAADFDQLALDIRRLLGRRVSKGNLVRALIALAAADPTLRNQLLHELHTRPTP